MLDNHLAMETIATFLRTHDCIRRHAGRTRNLLASDERLDPTRVSVLVDQWRQFDRFVRHHSSLKRQVIWPVLRATFVEREQTLHRLGEELRCLDTLLDRAAVAIPNVHQGCDARREALTSVAIIAEWLDERLVAEEHETVLWMVAAFTGDHWARVSDFNGTGLLEQELLPFVLPLLLEGMKTAQTTATLSCLSSEVRVRYHTTWLPVYRNQIRVLRGKARRSDAVMALASGRGHEPVGRTPPARLR